MGWITWLLLSQLVTPAESLGGLPGIVANSASRPVATAPSPGFGAPTTPTTGTYASSLSVFGGGTVPPGVAAGARGMIGTTPGTTIGTTPEPVTDLPTWTMPAAAGIGTPAGTPTGSVLATASTLGPGGVIFGALPPALGGGVAATGESLSTAGTSVTPANPTTIVGPGVGGAASGAGAGGGAVSGAPASTLPLLPGYPFD